MFAVCFIAQLIMKIATFLITASLLWWCSGCGGSTETQSLSAEEELQQTEEETQQTPQQAQQQHDQAVRDTATAAGLRTLIVKAYKQEDYAQARADIALLGSRYPESPLYAKLSRLNGILDSLVRTQQHRAWVKEERKGQLPGATAWGIDEYLDEFDKPSGHYFLVNTTVQWGKYANTAVVSEDMAARVVVDSSSSIHLMLYDEIPTYAVRGFGRRARTTYQRVDDYSKMRPVKVAAPTNYLVKVRSNAGKVYTFMAVNPVDRIVLDKADSETLHACLLEGGEVGFFITPANQPSTTYRFKLENADEYEQAYYQLRRR